MLVHRSILSASVLMPGSERDDVAMCLFDSC